MKINLFFFISQFNFGGAGNAIFNFLKNLDNKKYNLHMIFIGHSDYEKLFKMPAKSPFFILRPESVQIQQNGTFTGKIINRKGRGNYSLVTCRLLQTQIEVQLYISTRPLPNIGDILSICITHESCIPIRE